MREKLPPAVPWVVDGIVVRGALTILNGREGEGKSLLSMSLAAGVALGETEAGMRCVQGRALIIDSENGEHETWRRVHTLGLPGSVEVYEADALDLRSHLADVERVVARVKPDLLILDSFRSLWRGEENDAGQVAAVLDPLRNMVRRQNAGTILLHHSSKAGGDYRGSSAIGASAELGLTLGRAEGDEDRERRYLRCWKCRPAPRPHKRWLRLAAIEGQVFIEESVAPDAPAPVRSPLGAAVVQALGSEGVLSRSEVARAVGRPPKDRSVGRVLFALEADGLVHRCEGGWQGGRGGGTATLPPSQSGWAVA